LYESYLIFCHKVAEKFTQKKKKKSLSNEPTNTPLWMDVAWNGCKIEVNFIHWPQKTVV
jgi:hypothetical protein